MKVAENSLSFLWILYFLSGLRRISAFQNASNLLQVNILYRHGARYPDEAFPTSLFDAKTIKNNAYELTTVGMMEAFQLGQRLKQRYILGYPYELLSKDYNHSEILVRSSIRSRTMNTAYTQLAGMYPPTGDQIWNENLLWQPIPVYTGSELDDPVTNTLNQTTCPPMKKLYEHQLGSEYGQSVYDANKEFFTKLDNKTGYPEGRTNLENIWTIYDTFMMEQNMGLNSTWFYEPWRGAVTFLEQLTNVEHIAFGFTYHYHEAVQLLGGLLLDGIIDNIENSEKNYIKAHIYSTHEEKLSTVMKCLNLPLKKGGIPVTSALLFEVYKMGPGQNYSVKLIYHDKSTKTYEKLTIQGCEDPCYFPSFKSIVGPCIPNDWKTMCGLNVPTPGGTSKSKGEGQEEESNVNSSRHRLGIGVTGTIILLCIVLAGFIIYNASLRYKSSLKSDS